MSQTMQSINNPDVTKRDHFAFGAGRRICTFKPTYASPTRVNRRLVKVTTQTNYQY